jgi:hypothetical protein
MKKPFFLLTILLLFSCSEGRPGKKEEFRIGIPSSHMSIFKGKELSPAADFNMIVLKPEERARNLEVLIFSTRSSAFDCVVVPAPTAPILEKWADPFPISWGEGIRSEILSQFVRNGSLYALPVTLDFPVILYREDVFREEGAGVPGNLGELRGILRKLSKKRPAGIVSTLPEEILFLSLLACDENAAPARFYDRSSVGLLDFFYEFDLRPLSAQDASLFFEKEEAVAAFVQLSEAGRLIAEMKNKRIFLKAGPLPSTEKAYSIFNGLCLMGYGLEKKEMSALRSFVGEPFQPDLIRAGCVPVLDKDYQIGPLGEAVASTTVIPLPFGWEECEVLKEAIRDVLVNGLAPEGSLRRAEGRRKNMKGQ